MSTLKERLEKVAGLLDSFLCPEAASAVREAVVELKSAAEDRRQLDALECAGVDNWAGMDEVAALLREWDADDSAST